MKNFIFFVALLLLFSSCDRLLKRHEQETKEPVSTLYDSPDCDYFVNVEYVTDGDTFKGRTKSGKLVRFRVYGIDAPERDQAYGQKSRAYLSSLIAHQRVGIKVQRKSDQYGRPIVWAYTPDGKDISAEMLKAGMAWHYKQFNHSANYAAFEKNAKKAHLGLWHDKKPLEPWAYRKNKRKEINAKK